jgi:hypothetical protein
MQSPMQHWDDGSGAAMSMQQGWQGSGYTAARDGCVLLGEREDAWAQQYAGADSATTAGFAAAQQQQQQFAAAQQQQQQFAAGQQQWNDPNWNGGSCQYGWEQSAATYGNGYDQHAAAYGNGGAQWSGYDQQAATYGNGGCGSWGMGDGSAAAWAPPVKDETAWGMQPQCYAQQQQAWRYGAA